MNNKKGLIDSMETVIEWNVYYNLGLVKIVNNLLILLEWFGHFRFLMSCWISGALICWLLCGAGHFWWGFGRLCEWGLCLAITKLFCPFAFVCGLREEIHFTSPPWTHTCMCVTTEAQNRASPCSVWCTLRFSVLLSVKNIHCTIININ